MPVSTCHWKARALCVVNATGRIVSEGKVASEPEVLIGWFRGLGLAVRADRAGGRAAVAMAGMRASRAPLRQTRGGRVAGARVLLCTTWTLRPDIAICKWHREVTSVFGEHKIAIGAGSENKM